MNEGNFSILYLRLGGSFVPIGCVSDNGFNEDVELLPTTTRQTNGWSTSRPNVQSYSISFTGYSEFSIFGSDIASLDRLQILKRNRALVEWREEKPNNVVQRGFGIITNLSEANPVNQLSTFNGTIIGHGNPEMFIEQTLLSDGVGNGIDDGNDNAVIP